MASRFLNFCLILVFAFASLAILIHFNLFSLKDTLYDKYPNLKIRKYLFSSEPIFNKINNDYNAKFLPYTEFVKLDLIKKKINFNKNYYTHNSQKKNIAYSKYGSFYLDIHKKNLIITDYLGNIYNSEIEFLLNNNEKLETQVIKNNILKVERVHDTLIEENKIYIAYVKKIKECRKIFVSFADINLKELNFKELFVSDTCHNNASPGRMAIHNLENKKNLLLSISSGSYNSPSMESQDKKSIYGKTLLIDLENGNFNIFSLGHRVVQGLTVYKDLVIATEHGPRGGDEINLLKRNNNYGWPISSYGEKYNFNYESEPSYKKNHSIYGYKEPIFSYIPAIGISEIIKIPDNFSKMLQNVFIVSSLYGKSIFFVKFNSELNRVIFSEKVFLNQRIRDLKYEKKNNFILLAFEENGEIGILKKKE